MLNNLQVLRSLAAFVVVLAHVATLNEPVLLPWVGWGVSGVDLFFVISGFVMVHTTFGKTVTPVQFALNRIVRIVPMYWGLTLAIFAVALIHPAWLQGTRADWTELIKSLFFIPFMKSNGVVQPVLFLGWTLNYEMFFYAFFACSLLISSEILRLVVMTTALGLLVTVGFVIQPLGVIARFYTDPILLEFVFGMLLAYLHERLRARRFSHFSAIAALIAAVLFIAFQAYAVPDWHRAFAWGVPAAAIVFGAVTLESRCVAYRGRLLLLVGAASYMLYLTHPFAFIPVEKLAKRFALTQGASMIAMVLVELVVTVGVAIAVHLWLERPVTKFFQRLIRPGVPVPIAHGGAAMVGDRNRDYYR